MNARLKALLAHERMPLYAALVAIILLLPTLSAGMIMDDYVHKMIFLAPMPRPGGPRGDWDLFRFLDDHPDGLKYVVDNGMFPWWSAEGFHLAFLRPLASLWHSFDYRVLPDAHAFLHLESVLLFALGVVLVGKFYRRMLGPTVFAGLATLMFAMDDAHAFVLTWIANRHAILSLVFGIASLWAYDRARRDDWKTGSWLSPLLFALSMLAGESGAATSAYLFAYAVFIDRAPLRARAISFAPFVAIAIVWSVFYKWGGYGAAGGTFYIDPLGQFSLFARAVMQRMPVLLAGQLAAPPADMWMMSPPDVIPMLIAASSIVVFLIAAGLLITLRTNPMAWFFAVGMVGSLVPSCATLPGDRNLLFAGIGGFGLVALMFETSFDLLSRPARAYAKTVCGVFVLFHIILAPLLLPVKANAIGKMLNGFTSRAIDSFAKPSEWKDRTLVVVDAPDSVITNTAMAARFLENTSQPAALRLLMPAVQGTLSIARPRANTFSMTLSAGHMHEQTSVLFRDPDKKPLRVGDKVTIPGMTAEIMSMTPDGRLPLRVDFHFDKSLDDESFLWLYWNENRFAPLVLPAIGEEKTLPVTPYGKAMEG